MLDDVALIKRIRRGDRASFDELFHRYGDRLRGFAFQISVNEEVADDLVQEAFLAAFRGIGGYRGDGQMFSWLCGIVVRKNRDWNRRRSTEPLDSEPAESVDSDRLDMDQAIGNLAIAQREAFVLVKVVGLSHEEAAHELKKPVGTVKWLCAEAVRALQAKLKEEVIHEIA